MSRVLVDTNVVISALLFPHSTPADALALVLERHRLVLTQWVIDELLVVVERKRPDLLPALRNWLEEVDFELARPGGLSVPISDPDDQPILDAAVSAGVEIILTGDRHFLSLSIESPRILTAREFLTSFAESRGDS